MLVGLTFLAFSLFTAVHHKELDDDMLLYWSRNDSSSCAPFTTFFISCNKCVCSADGTAFCTRMACFKKPHFGLLDESPNEPIDKPDGSDSSG